MRGGAVGSINAGRSSGKCANNGKCPKSPIHDDLVQRDFTAKTVNDLWLTDIIKYPTDEGKLHLCAIKDACSGWIVGYSIDSLIKNRLDVDAPGHLHPGVTMWLGALCIRTSDLEFRLRKLVAALNRHRIIGSMGKISASGDKGIIQSLFALTTSWTAVAGALAKNCGLRSSPGSNGTTTDAAGCPACGS